MSLEIKTGTITMPLIEQKIGFGFAQVYPDKLCDRCENCFTPRSQRNSNARKASSQPCRSWYRK